MTLPAPGPSTRSVHVPRHLDAVTRAIVPPIVENAAYAYYPGLPDHPNHDVARRQMSGFGGVLSFELRGGAEAAARMLPRLRYAYMAANLGQVETIAGTPATTSHVELTAEERAAAGVPEGLVRYSVGIEDPEDLRADLRQALESL